MQNSLVCSDARLKLVITLVLLVICALVPFPIIGTGLVSHISVCSILLIFLFVGILLLPNKKEFVRRLTFFLPFILVTFGLPLFFTPGKIITHGITYEGLHKGSVLGIKVFLAIGYSLFFVLSTPPVEIAKSLDWITMNRLKLGETLLVALKFAELVKNGHKNKSWVATLRYAIEKSKEFITQ